MPSYARTTESRWGFQDYLESGGYTYVGYEDRDGNWKVMRIDDTTTQARYVSGSGGLPASATWAALSYDTFANTF